MATSGSWNFSMTAAQVIASAYEDLGMISPGGTVASADSVMALSRLNQIVKQFQGTADGAPGLKVWTRQRVVLFPVSGQSRYLIGPAASDDRASANSLATTLGAAKTASATAITVTSTTGMTAADIIGFVTTVGTIGWGAISSVDSGTTLTISANSIVAAASGAVVYTFTSKAQRFVDWESVVLRDNSAVGQPIDMEIPVYTEVAEYENLAQKLAPGDPTYVLIEPQRLNTVVTLDFASTSMYKTLRLTVIYPSEDYDATTDDIAYPQEWFAALSWELAFRLSPSVGRWTKEMADNRLAALSIARNLNPENSVAFFEPGKY